VLTAAADQIAKDAQRAIEREQEALLAKKYGGMLKRKQPLMPKVGETGGGKGSGTHRSCGRVSPLKCAARWLRLRLRLRPRPRPRRAHSSQRAAPECLRPAGPAPHPAAPSCTKPCNPAPLSQEHKYFDSADWALAKEGKGEQPSVSAEESLPPRTSPAAPLAAHRASKLEAPLSDPMQAP
jgi:hypothetical protein